MKIGRTKVNVDLWPENFNLAMLFIVHVFFLSLFFSFTDLPDEFGRQTIKVSTTHRSNDHAAGGRAHAISYHGISTRYSRSAEWLIGNLFLCQMLRAIWRNDGFVGSHQCSRWICSIRFDVQTISYEF